MTFLLCPVLLCLLHCCPVAWAFGTGARDVLSVCTDQMPSHNVAPQTREAPYTVQVIPSSDFLPGETIKVVIASDVPFKGFLLSALSTYDNLPIGSMVITNPGLSKLVCEDGATATHTSNVEKSEVSFNWVAPDDIDPKSSVIFRATVVQNFQTFWTKVESVKIAATTQAPPPATIQPPQQPPPQSTPASTPRSNGSVILLPNTGGNLSTPTTPAAPATGQSGSASIQYESYLRVDPACGKSMGCFHDCSNGRCSYVITWTDLGDDLHMTMTYRLPRADLDNWIAIGFSKDLEMGNDSVTECTMEGKGVLVKQSYNDGLFNNYLDDKEAALSEMTGGVADGILHCEFKRKKTYKFDPMVFDLNLDFYLMVATGEAMNGNKFPHTAHPVVSSQPIDLQGYQTPTTSASLRDPECSKSKGCMHDCNNGPCSYVISWKNRKDDLYMTMTFRLPRPDRDQWIAVGFSKDKNMGEDSVIECIMDGGQVVVKHSYNDGLANVYLQDKQAGLSAMSGRVADGVLHCEFSRQKKYDKDPKVFDLNTDYYLLVAQGEATNGEKLPHTKEPTESDHVIDLQSLELVAGSEPERSVAIYIHSILMIIAWALLTSIGITSAKYGKPMWPKCMIFGSNIWFHLHRSAMAIVTVFTSAGVIAMAVECEGYCQLPTDVLGKSYWPLHPPLGIFVLLLTLANPIMAFFRPGPNAASRHVFNWMHWGVGVLAWIFASLTMFIGLDLQRAQAPREAVDVLLVWGVYHIFFIVAMEILPRSLARCYEACMLKRGKIYDLERVRMDNDSYLGDEVTSYGTVNPTSSQKETTSPPTSSPKPPMKEDKEMSREELKVKRIMLLFHYGVTFIMTLTLLLIVFIYVPPAGVHRG